MKTHWRILVVAANGYGESLASRLQADGHSAQITRSCGEALNIARDRQHAIYFIDYEMVGAGMDMVSAIRAVHPEASVVVMSLGSALGIDEFAPIVQQVLPDSSNGHGRLISLAEMEKRLIGAMLEHTGGNIRESSKILGVDRSTLYEKIKRYEIPRCRVVKNRKPPLEEPTLTQ